MALLCKQYILNEPCGGSCGLVHRRDPDLRAEFSAKRPSRLEVCEPARCPGAERCPRLHPKRPVGGRGPRRRAGSPRKRADERSEPRSVWKTPARPGGRGALTAGGPPARASGPSPGAREPGRPASFRLPERPEASEPQVPPEGGPRLLKRPEAPEPQASGTTPVQSPAGLPPSSQARQALLNLRKASSRLEVLIQAADKLREPARQMAIPSLTQLIESADAELAGLEPPSRKILQAVEGLGARLPPAPAPPEPSSARDQKSSASTSSESDEVSSVASSRAPSEAGSEAPKPPRQRKSWADMAEAEEP